MLDKNILALIARHSDDITSLNILNSKKFPDMYYFNVFNFKYPDLSRFKKEGKSYKSFYFEMLEYIRLLNKKYDIVYEGGKSLLIIFF